jgi:hypothetical protein
MVTTIHLDDKPTGGCKRVDDAFPHDDLPAKRDAELGARELNPELGFGKSGLSTERASAVSEELRASGVDRAF